MDTNRPSPLSRLVSLTRQFAIIPALLALGFALCALLIPAESEAVKQQLIGFPDSVVATQKARPLIIAALCFLPAIGAILYCLGGTLDRYISRHFLSMFALCLSALCSIWLLLDLTDHISDFRGSHDVSHTIWVYYGTRMPAVLLLLLPYSLLLSLLESLGKLSSNREIIAIIQSGRGVLRLTAPLIIAGVLCTILTLGLNYHWAPTAEGRQREILDEAIGKTPTEASQVIYRSVENERLWMVGAFPPDYQKGRPLIDVEVTITDAQAGLKTRLSARQASWVPATGIWTFEDASFCHYRQGQPPLFEKSDGPLVIDSWSETPWQIIKPGLSAEYLGIPDLSAWIRTNAMHPQFAAAAPYLTHWHYRWALPFTCLITVMLATPLAIHFSRRGAGGGIFLSIVLSALMLLINAIILAFGESGNLPPMLAAWLPNMIFGLIGVYLYRCRINGRPIYNSLRRMLPFG